MPVPNPGIVVDATRNSVCDTIVDSVDGGVAAAVLNIFDNNGDTIVSYTLNTTAFGAAGASVVGEAIANAFTSTAAAIASANAYGWSIVKDSVVQVSRNNGDAKSIAGGGDRDAIAPTGGNAADLVLNQGNLAIASGQNVSLSGNLIFRVPTI